MEIGLIVSLHFFVACYAWILMSRSFISSCYGLRAEYMLAYFQITQAKYGLTCCFVFGFLASDFCRLVVPCMGL